MSKELENPIPVLSIEEANALVPELNDIVAAQIQRAGEIEKQVVELYLQNNEGKVEEGATMLDLTVKDDDRDDIGQLKRLLAQQISHYQEVWEDVERLGAVVKDPSTGLLDFYGRVDDRLVWLCWQYGESTIEYYHDLDAGYAGRRPLAPVRQRMLN